MKKIQTARQQISAPGGALGGPFPELGAATGTATISHGPYRESIPIAGLTIGQVRSRFRDRYNLPTGGQGLLDGQAVDDDTMIREGQMLTFRHRSNTKGSSAHSVSLDGDRLVVESPEGSEASATLSEILPTLRPRWFGDCVWIDGVKMVLEMQRGAVVVHQTPSRVHNLQWITGDSLLPFGPRADYRDVRIALPYVIVLAAFRVTKKGQLQLSAANECFFTNTPLRSVDDPLLYPALLNVSRFTENGEEHPLAWICSQNLDREFEKIPETGKRSRAAIQELVHHMFNGGFNRSSEHHEGSSWFGATAEAEVDARVRCIDDWQAATEQDPMFATQVPWLPTGMSLVQVVQRIACLLKLDGDEPLGAAALARAVIHRSIGSKHD